HIADNRSLTRQSRNQTGPVRRYNTARSRFTTPSSKNVSGRKFGLQRSISETCHFTLGESIAWGDRQKYPARKRQNLTTQVLTVVARKLVLAGKFLRRPHAVGQNHRD